jgi:hypothetical protein
MFLMANMCLPKNTERFILELKDNSKNGMRNHMPFAEDLL